MFSLQNNKDKQINKDLFNTSTIESLGTAKDKDFHTKFFTSDRVTYWLGLFGQFLSAITEAVFIFRGCGGELPVMQQSNILAVTAALVGVYFFEVVGVRVYLVSIVRQITNKDFNSTQKIILLIFNILFCSSILFANFFTSLTGQSTTFISVKSSVDNSDTLTKIKEQLQNDIDTIRLNAIAYKSKLEATATNDKQLIENTYKPILKDLRASKWVEDANKATINKEIETTNKAQLQELAAITANLKNRVDQVDTSTAQAITALTTTAQLKIKSINKNENGELSIYAIIESYSYYLLLVFMTLSILAIIYREVYISGSKQELKTIEVKKRPVLIIILLYGLYMKFYHFWYWLTVKIVGSKAFNYSKVMQTKEDYLSSEISSNELLQKAIDYLKGKDQQTPIQISAFGQNNTGNKNSFQNSVSNCDTTGLNSNSNSSDSAKKQALNRYKISTIQMQYKRSDLVKNSLSSKKKTQEINTAKYKAAKKDLEPHGVQFIENRNSVTIKV